MKKIFVFLLTLVVFCSLPLVTYATEVENEIIDSIGDELEDFKSSLPDYVLDFLPSDTLNGDYSSLLSDGLDEGKIIDYIIEYFFLGLDKTVKTFSAILVLLLLSSIFEMLSASLSNPSLSLTFTACSGLCVALTIFNACSSLASNVTVYTQTLCKVMNSFAPIMATMQIMSGNITTAAISNSAMVLFISLTDGFLIACMLPLVKICMMFSCVKALGGIEFGGISKLIRTTFTSVTIFVMSLFMFIFSFKNVLSQSADTLTLKTARFAISSFIPIVGASINDALRTVSSSLGLIKSSCGILAILIIALIMLPIIIYLFLNKLSFGLLAGISRVINCEKQASILEEADSLCAYMLTLVSTTCVLFIFAITIFIKTSSEVGI